MAKPKEKAKNPLMLQGLLWAMTNSLSTDQDTNLFDLYGLSSVGDHVSEQPYEPSHYAGTDVPSRAVQPNATTFSTLTSLGYDQTCTTGKPA